MYDFDTPICLNKNGDGMRTYYLFLIQGEIANTLEEKEFELYYMLKRIIEGKEETISYRIPCYLQLCKSWPKEVLNHYFTTKYPHLKKKYDYEIAGDSYFIRSSYLKIVTSKTIPGIFRLLNYMDPYIFVCDFENGDYFYLKAFMNHIKIKS